MDISTLLQKAIEFEPELEARKQRLAPKSEWYGYGSLGNFHVLNEILTGAHRDLSQYLDLGPIADIGAADGDVSFLLESLGYEVDIIDYGPTNWNGLRGARLLAAETEGRVSVHEVDLDTQWALPRTYGLAIFLGILYHLQNPYFALRELASSAQYALLSTRIAQVTAENSVRLKDAPVAYLLAPDECNNDSTNYWIFSELGLRRILDRTGWEILDFSTIGCTIDSEPADMARDERAFCLLRSRPLA
jgi:tRNA (mo5U34)-methyltransferase